MVIFHFWAIGNAIYTPKLSVRAINNSIEQNSQAVSQAAAFQLSSIEFNSSLNSLVFFNNNFTSVPLLKFELVEGWIFLSNIQINNNFQSSYNFVLNS